MDETKAQNAGDKNRLQNGQNAVLQDFWVKLIKIEDPPASVIEK